MKSSDQDSQPEVHQITAANAYLYSPDAQSPRGLGRMKRFWNSRPRPQQVLLIAGTVIILFSALMIGLSIGAGKNSTNTKTPQGVVAANQQISSSTTQPTDTNEEINYEDANQNGVADVDEVNNITEEEVSWWQSLLSKVQGKNDTVSTDTNISEDGSDSSFVAVAEETEDIESDGEDMIIEPSNQTAPDVEDKITTPITYGNGNFSIVALPDTQRELQNDTKYGTTLFNDSMQWIIANKDKRNISVVVHSGDVVHASASTGSPKSTQMVKGFYKVATQGFSLLDNAGMIYSIAPGNHDSSAICSSDNGGSIWCNDQNSAKTAKLLSVNTEFDKIYTTNRSGLRGLTTYNPGRVENSYRTFSSGSSKWLILTVQYLVPPDVFRWAQSVISSHPNYNVVLVAHRYMSSDGNIMSSCEGNCTSAKKIFSDIVMKYPNVKFVVSGHAGKQAIRIDTSASGNKVVEFQTTMHETTRNPLRLISIDTNNGTVMSRLCMATSKTSESGCSEKKISGMNYIKSR